MITPLILQINTMSRLRNCCFTINNIDANNNIENYFNFPIDGVKYCIYQKEKVTRDHLQGYIEFEAPKSQAQIKDILGKEAHIEKRRGTALQAQQYCMKNDSRVSGPYEFGVISHQGKRSDLKEIADRFRSGESIKDIIDGNETQFVRYGRGLRELQALLQPRPRSYTKKEVVVLWGPPGVGKSYFVNHIMELRQKLLYIKSPNTKWWDNYQGESDILLDEFPGTMTARDAKIILGEVNGPLETKGGSFTTDKMERFWITSNYEPGMWFENAKDIDRSAVQREVNGPLETKGGSFTTDKMERFWITSNYEPGMWFENAKDIDRSAVQRRLTTICHVTEWQDTAEIFYKFFPPPSIQFGPPYDETQNIYK
ncbi:replication-associated protein [Giant panda circovirus 4]|uniref:replication-associated protein n=1 Tax=Giant panda circovirus 4 TaxID=2016459 RepID=UPI000B5BC9FC|nr:replication-associated protein [Giant panda circovirus 4]ASH99191.1 replication-associated protein [Giant panda circovirus 4]